MKVLVGNQVLVGKANAIAAGAYLADCAAGQYLDPISKAELEGWLLNVHVSSGQKKARAALGRAGWGVKVPVPALACMPGEGEGGMAETLPRPGVEIEDGCRVRPGLFDGNGGSRLSRLAGGQLPVTICHQESLWACFMAPL
ncbi:hypothetical protein [Comamonas terrigena]|uniref:hypothetical protein n=1 Tax=Comamonas terrigena TaxID=32013 RepID=UPI0028B20CC6|nr:hypothetical protein [Comamonas terrigena]